MKVWHFDIKIFKKLQTVKDSNFNTKKYYQLTKDLKRFIKIKFVFIPN